MTDKKKLHRRKRLVDSINYHVKTINSLMQRANNEGLRVDAILDTKQLAFPVLDIRLYKEIQL